MDSSDGRRRGESCWRARVEPRNMAELGKLGRGAGKCGNRGYGWRRLFSASLRGAVGRGAPAPPVRHPRRLLALALGEESRLQAPNPRRKHALLSSTSPRMLVFSALFASALLTPATAQVTSALESATTHQPFQSVGRGPVPRRDLGTGGVHVYSVLLRSGEYLHVRIDSYGIDVALAIYSPGAVKLAESNYRLPGPKRLAIISATSGNHRLEVRALETSPATGHYTLEITDLRAAVRGDSDRVAAIRLLAEAESLRGRWDAKSSQYAILKYRTALRSWGSSGDVLGAILTLRRLGDTCDAIGQAQEALRYYQESWQRSKEAKDAWEENQALNNLSHVYLNIGRLETASEYGRLALELSRRIQNTSGEAAALNSIGNVKLRLGETRECLAIYNSALGIAEKSGDRRIQARTLLNIGYAYSDLRETSEALESYDHALSLWTTLEDRWGRATTLNALGHLLGNISEKQRALGYYREAREIFSTLGDPYGEGVAFAGMGFQYLELGDVQIALEYFEEQLRLHRKVKLRLGEAVALVKIGVCFSL